MGHVGDLGLGLSLRRMWADVGGRRADRNSPWYGHVADKADSLVVSYSLHGANVWRGEAYPHGRCIIMRLSALSAHSPWYGKFPTAIYPPTGGSDAPGLEAFGVEVSMVWVS